MFGSRSLRRALRRTPFRRYTDYQSAVNPTQWGNLPDAEGVELALPEFGDPAEAKQASVIRFAWQAGLGLAFAAGVVTVSAAAGRADGGAAVAATATLLVTGCALRNVGRWWIALAPPAAVVVYAGVVASGWPLTPAAVAAVLAALAADRFAGQSVHFQSRLPLSAGLGELYRRMWGRRFSSPAAQLRGELYPALLVALPLAAFAGAAAVRAGEPGGWPVVFRLLAFAAGFAAFAAVAAAGCELAASRRRGFPAAGIRECRAGAEPGRATLAALRSARESRPGFVSSPRRRLRLPAN